VQLDSIREKLKGTAMLAAIKDTECWHQVVHYCSQLLKSDINYHEATFAVVFIV